MDIPYVITKKGSKSAFPYFKAKVYPMASLELALAVWVAPCDIPWNSVFILKINWMQFGGRKEKRKLQIFRGYGKSWASSRK